jgi:hypothetical protein
MLDIDLKLNEKLAFPPYNSYTIHLIMKIMNNEIVANIFLVESFSSF